MRVWWVLSRGSRSLTVLCALCAHGLCGLHVLYIMRASCSFGSNIATKFGGAKILILKQGHNGGAKRGVTDDGQEEGSQMPAECQEEDSQMPAEEGRIPEEVPSSAHLGSGACGASPADVSSDTGLPFAVSFLSRTLA